MTLEKYLLAFPELCTGCNRCAYACSAEKTGMFMPSRSRIHINNFPLEGFSAPSICFQCANPDCIKACPEEAIYRNTSDVVIIDQEKCVGCGDCVEACPYGMIGLDEKNSAYKCDYCGGDPACVEECEPKAILFSEPDKEKLKQRALQMKHRSESGHPDQKRAYLGTKLFSLRPKGPAPLPR
jgi:Fe-S-cluster-containing dehydrogenase component